MSKYKVPSTYFISLIADRLLRFVLATPIRTFDNSLRREWFLLNNDKHINSTYIKMQRTVYFQPRIHDTLP